MKELQCLKTNYYKTILRFFLDFIIIFVLLFLITFLESFIKNFGNALSYIFKERLLLFFVMFGISVLLSVLLAFIEINSRCLYLRYDDDKVVFIKNKKEESMRLSHDLYVRAEFKKGSAVISFRQNKRVINAYLEDANANEFINHLKEKEIKVDLIANKK